MALCNENQEEFIPTITGKSFLDQDMREIIGLPARYGGLSIGNVSEYSQKEYENSVRVTSQLTDAIISRENTLSINNEEVNKVMREITSEREKFYQEKKK